LPIDDITTAWLSVAFDQLGARVRSFDRTTIGEGIGILGESRGERPLKRAGSA
jgi:hypothetical protein